MCVCATACHPPYVRTPLQLFQHHVPVLPCACRRAAVHTITSRFLTMSEPRAVCAHVRAYLAHRRKGMQARPG